MPPAVLMCSYGPSQPHLDVAPAQVDTRVQFYKWFNELADRGLIPRYPGYERGAKLPPPDQVQGPAVVPHIGS